MVGQFRPAWGKPVRRDRVDAHESRDRLFRHSSFDQGFRPWLCTAPMTPWLVLRAAANQPKAFRRHHWSTKISWDRSGGVFDGCWCQAPGRDGGSFREAPRSAAEVDLGARDRGLRGISSTSTRRAGANGDRAHRDLLDVWTTTAAPLVFAFPRKGAEVPGRRLSGDLLWSGAGDRLRQRDPRLVALLGSTFRCASPCIPARSSRRRTMCAGSPFTSHRARRHRRRRRRARLPHSEKTWSRASGIKFEDFGDAYPEGYSLGVAALPRPRLYPSCGDASLMA